MIMKLNTLRPRQNDRHFPDAIFKCIFLITIKIPLKFVSNGPVYNIPALVQTKAWRWSGDKPLSEPMFVSLLTHICITKHQWVKSCDIFDTREPPRQPSYIKTLPGIILCQGDWDSLINDIFGTRDTPRHLWWIVTLPGIWTCATDTLTPGKTDRRKPQTPPHPQHPWKWPIEDTPL